MVGIPTAAPRDLRAPAKSVSVASTANLILFSRTIRNEFGTPKSEPITSSSNDLLGGITPVSVRGLVVEGFHPINTQLLCRIRIRA